MGDVATEASPSTEGVASITVDVDIALESPNRHSNEHYITRAHRRAKEQKATLEALSVYEPPSLDVSTEATILITRLCAQTFDDDNLAFSAKSIRDAVALWLSVDDADPRLTWKYSQEAVREKKVPNGKRNFKPGFKTWVRVTISLSGAYLQRSAGGPPRVALEDVSTEGEPPKFGEPIYKWATKPGVDLVVLPRMGGKKGNVPVELHVTAKEHQGIKYVHLCVWFMKKSGRNPQVYPWRSRGAAIREEEVPAVVAALQAYLQGKQA